MNNWQCLTDSELDLLYHGAGRREALGHVFICPACRGRLLILEDSLASHLEMEFEENFALAAKGTKVLPVRSLSTVDESLICRLERESGRNDITLTVLADKAEWGDTVVIWPGAGEPFSVPIGEKVYTKSGLLGAINLWTVSAAEAKWQGKVEDIPEEIKSINNSILIKRKETLLQISLSNSSLLSAVVLRDSRGWRNLKVPTEISVGGNMSIYLYTPLTGVELK